MIYIVFDLEATAWDTFPEKNHNFNEVIEIGAVKLDNDLNEISQFDTFIKPVINPTLSPFCLGLTHITQEQVDSAVMFADALREFHRWIVEGTEQEPIHSYSLLSWGEYDKKQLNKEMTKKRPELETLSEEWKWQMFSTILDQRHTSLKHRYMDKFQIHKGAGVGATLKRLGLQFEGTQHRGIDDAINIARIFRKIRDRVDL
jgi:3'-5' exoribonuclease 1